MVRVGTKAGHAHGQGVCIEQMESALLHLCGKVLMSSHSCGPTCNVQLVQGTLQVTTCRALSTLRTELCICSLTTPLFRDCVLCCICFIVHCSIVCMYSMYY